MNSIVRNIALTLRSRSEQKQIQTVLRQFEEWRGIIAALPDNICTEKKLAIVRLDDIGDYLLWRNCLGMIGDARQFAGSKITLIGNVVWKPIFEAYDAAYVHHVIWVDKQQYMNNSVYRQAMWAQVRSENFETIICPSRTRPLLIDDLLVLASGAKHRIACENTYEWPLWNTTSDANYTQLFPKEKTLHEFNYNQNFAAFIGGQRLQCQSLLLPIKTENNAMPKQIICFIGASAKSKTWPLSCWITLVKLLLQNGFEPLLSGGKNERAIADKIVAATQVPSIVGQTNLVATLRAMACINAVITGDTMAAHAAVSLQKPTVILANGVNAKRFVAYEEAGFQNVKTVYTQQYLRSNKDTFYKAVSKDMYSIKPQTIVTALNGLLG
ncbi:MAG: glycosyltransferase family 9 protein [Chitinophagaceae bacterium]|nr:glycosyltransferase family 9 protein [Chitinophagaceae bacterium]